MKYSIIELDKIKEILQDRIYSENGRIVSGLCDVYYGHARDKLGMSEEKYKRLSIMSDKYRIAFEKIEGYFSDATDEFINNEIK